MVFPLQHFAKTIYNVDLTCQEFVIIPNQNPLRSAILIFVSGILLSPAANVLKLSLPVANFPIWKVSSAT